MTNLRMTTVVTAAVFFLAIGTFTSVTIQGAYQVLVAIPLIYYVWLAKGRAFRLPASAWWLLAFSVIALISILINLDTIPKPSKNLGRIKYFLMAAFGIFPFGVWLRTVSNRTKNRLERWFYLSVVISSIWILYQYLILDVERLKPLTETMRYAYGTALIILIGSGLALHSEKTRAWYSRRWAVLGLSFALIATVLINSRGAQASVLLGLPVLIWFWNRKWAIALAAVFGMVGSFVAWNYFYGAQNQTKVRILDNSKNASDQIRHSQWKAAFIAWKEKPILGWGFSNFHSQVKRIKYEYDLPTKDYVDAHSHNVPLEIASGTGLIGFILFMGAFFTWAWECWTAGGLIRSVMMPFFVAIAFQAQFEVLLDANNATWIGFLYAITLASNKRYQIPFE